MNWLLFLVLLCLAGCCSGNDQVPQPLSPLMPDYGVFSPSEYREIIPPTRGGELVTVRFDNVPLGRALATLSDRTGRAIVWAEALDTRPACGFFDGQPLGLVLDSLGRRVGAEVNDLDGVYYVGTLGPDDLASAVVALPPGDAVDIERALQKLISARGKLVVVGGSIWLRDSASTVSKVLRELERHREAACRRYVAEIFLIRCRTRDMLDLSAELSINAIDLLAGPNLDELFSVLLRADANHEGAEVLQRPILQLADGQAAQLHAGRTVVVPSKAINDSGVIQTTGYDTFTAGLKIGLTAHRASVDKISVAFAIEVSEFGERAAEGVPDKDTEQVESVVLLRDGEVCLVGGIGREGLSNGLELFGITHNVESETVLIWLRVRELVDAERTPRRPCRGGRPRPVAGGQRTAAGRVVRLPLCSSESTPGTGPKRKTFRGSGGRPPGNTIFSPLWSFLECGSP